PAATGRRPAPRRAPGRLISGDRIAVLGAGSWGTALAIQFARAGHSAVLWARDADQVDALASARRNARYLSDAPFPPQLEVASDLRAAVARAEITLVAVPSQG